MQLCVISDCSCDVDIQSIIVYCHWRIQNQFLLKGGRVLTMVSIIIQEILKQVSEIVFGARAFCLF